MAEVVRAGEAVKGNLRTQSAVSIAAATVANRALDLAEKRWPWMAISPGDRALLFLAIAGWWVNWRAHVRVKKFQLGALEFDPDARAGKDRELELADAEIGRLRVQLEHAHATVRDDVKSAE